MEGNGGCGHHCSTSRRGVRRCDHRPPLSGTAEKFHPYGVFAYCSYSYLLDDGDISTNVHGRGLQSDSNQGGRELSSVEGKPLLLHYLIILINFCSLILRRLIMQWKDLYSGQKQAHPDKKKERTVREPRTGKRRKVKVELPQALKSSSPTIVETNNSKHHEYNLCVGLSFLLVSCVL